MLCRWSEIRNLNHKTKYKTIKTLFRQLKLCYPPAIFDTAKGRVSSFTSLRNGNFTVEAALVIPMVFFVMVMLISMLDMLRVWSSVTLSLNESAKTLGMYAYAAESMIEQTPLQVIESGACIAYAKTQLPEFERAEISLSNSSYRNHVIELNAVITYRFPVRFAMIQDVEFSSKARVHTWTGYRSAEEGNLSSGERMVCITNRQTVYHTKQDCSHLELSIMCVERQLAKWKRNENGECYQACQKCSFEDEVETVYLTLYGDRYHSNVSCQGLKRTVQMVPEYQVEDLKECSRCADGGA